MRPDCIAFAHAGQQSAVALLAAVGRERFFIERNKGGRR